MRSAPAARTTARARRSGARLGAIIGFAAVLGLSAGCRSRRDGGEGDAGKTLPATPPGYERVTSEGWTIALPSSFVVRPPRGDTETMIWLVYAIDAATPGAPAVLFARHSRPAEFPSHVFGLTLLEQLQREPTKRVISHRQHEIGGTVVTDLEVEAADPDRPRRQWRRVFVHEGVAYLLTVSIAATEAERMRAPAQTILDSLTRE